MTWVPPWVIDRHRRRSLEAVPLHVPAGSARTAWRAAASAVKLAIVAPVTNPTLVPAGRPSSSTSQPPATSSATAAAGEIDVQAGVLVPGAGQPVRRERRRQAAADDEPEVASAGAGDQARLGGCGELLDHRRAGRSGLPGVARPSPSVARRGRPEDRRVGSRATPGSRSRCRPSWTGAGLRRSSWSPPRVPNGWDARPFDRLMLP